VAGKSLFVASRSSEEQDFANPQSLPCDANQAEGGFTFGEALFGPSRGGERNDA
jgi:hypothetical protein